MRRPRRTRSRPWTWNDHFNGRLPTIDVDGFALKTMEHVRHHDPTGPLADDATLRIADHYFKKADYENSAAYYEQLIKDHPKSDLLQRAQLGFIDSEMKGYLGPQYDSEGLEKAGRMIRQTMTSFPDRPADVTERLYRDLDLISDQQAEISFHTGDFYKRTGYASGAEYYFGEVRARWPKSPWADKAKVEMASLAKMPRKKALPSKILTLPGAPDPNATGNSMGSMATMPGGGGGGMGMPAGAGALRSAAARKLTGTRGRRPASPGFSRPPKEGRRSCGHVPPGLIVRWRSCWSR